jgi:hypothetical protein
MGFPVSNRAAGYVVTASDWNDDIVANLNDLNTRMNLASQLTQETVAVGANGSVAQDPDTTVLLLNPSGAYDIYGAAVPTRAPWEMKVINIGASNVTLKDEDATEGTPAKRLFLPNGLDLVLQPGQGLTFCYISIPIGARWVAVVAA